MPTVAKPPESEQPPAPSPAERLAQALDGKRLSGGGWSARCPAHDDRNPSLSIGEGAGGRVLVHCFRCAQEVLIAELRRLGLWDGTGDGRTPSRRRDPDQDLERERLARDLWETSSEARGTLVEKYLKSRGIRLPPPVTLRFRSGFTSMMVALVVDPMSSEPHAVHRTYLTADGRKAEPDARKMLGPCAGNVVMLGAPIPGNALLIGEGIETCLSAMQMFKKPAWAALAAGFLPKVNLPAEIRAVDLLVDVDENGVGEAKAREAARRFAAEGRDVRLRFPRLYFDFRFGDFNDALRQRAMHRSAQRDNQRVQRRRNKP